MVDMGEICVFYFVGLLGCQFPIVAVIKIRGEIVFFVIKRNVI